MMQIAIKEYESKDEDQVKKLIKICFEENYLLSILKSPKLIKAFSAYHKNKLIGVAFAWKSDFHPYCTYFRLLVNPFYNTKEIAGNLLLKMEQLEFDYPVQTSIWETNVGLKYFYEQNGFRTIRKTYMPKLEVSNMTDFMPEIYSGSYSLKTLADIMSDHQLMEKLILLVKKVYEQTHLANPVAEMSLDSWRSLVLADDVITDGSYIYVNADHNEIMAYSFLHESEDTETLELGWCGSVDNKRISLIPQLVMQQIAYTNNHGYKYMEGEFDTTSEYAMKVLRNIPFPPTALLITLQKS
ncbi:hypothetical protein CIL05_09915 [Virgibacillus profundi]|uniref:N-acetyltransferase domain-containing protein n=1 Tax=Virgibacillus profundi TaxID=2024555 RepID=A0A2A2IEV6_9BACI|nr:hypothetical protein [Virgibacillus profundi]PAV29680.1 hypothetical protein CIL05_09915 [Virgibacillus profundi]PXY53852.1 hypothetical protein CIT14_10010 [Virgibacillus profundi]